MAAPCASAAASSAAPPYGSLLRANEQQKLLKAMNDAITQYAPSILASGQFNQMQLALRINIILDSQAHASDKKLSIVRRRQPCVRIPVDLPLLYNNIDQHLAALINAEKEAIYIASPYVSDATIIVALKRALKRGVRVNIVTKNHSASTAEFDDQKEEAAEQINALWIEVLRTAGAIVTTYKDTPMHAKYMLLQSQKIVVAGSANFSHHGCTGNHEIVCLYDKKYDLYDAFKAHHNFLCKREPSNYRQLCSRMRAAAHTPVFSGDICDAILDIIRSEPKNGTLLVATFCLDDRTIISALENPWKRGCHVHILLDNATLLPPATIH